MFLDILHHWVFWILLGGSTAWIAWVFSELRHAAPDSRDTEPDPNIPAVESGEDPFKYHYCEEGILRDIDNYEIIKTWKPRTTETKP